ncbi:hypothetical protein D3C80_1814510 [compost metagenome]
MDIAVADLAVERLIAKQRPTRLMQLGNQAAIGGIRRRIRQGNAGQWVEMGEAVAGQFQAQIQGPEVHRIGEGSGQLDAGGGDRRLGLERKGS